MKKPKIVLAFSGGLDTSFCVLWLRETKNADVVTAVVDTGGFSAAELKEIEARAKELGACEHFTLDARQEVFDRFITPLIQGNVLRGKVYPLSVAAERVVQAEQIASLARRIGADAAAHGSTGAGNDQIRFDAAFQTLIPELKIHAPIRELGWPREKEAAYLSERGFSVPSKTTAYSINTGLWGTTVGGKETHDPWTEIPDAAFPGSNGGVKTGMEIIIGFEKGVPVSIGGKKLPGVALVTELNRIGRLYGIGRGVHLGDTVLGIKGRIGFEAPAPTILISAHRELEKLVLTRWQSFWKDHLAEFYGQLLHEGLAYDPVMRDIEAMIRSSQRTVTGEARLKLAPGSFAITGVKSPHSLVAAQSAVYGETTGLWTGEEAAGFSKLHSLPMALARKAAQTLEGS